MTKPEPGNNSGQSFESLPTIRAYTPNEYKDEYTEGLDNARTYARLAPEKTDRPKKLIFFGTVARREGDVPRFFDEQVSSLPGEIFVHTRVSIRTGHCFHRLMTLMDTL